MKRSHRAYDSFKRAADALLAACLLVVLSPLFALVAIVVLVADGPPVLFEQQRPGLAGRPFTLYKFRTMAEHSSTSDIEAVASDAQRLTRVGRVLRKTSLDELPQLFNVLRGQMSFVGPRPLLMEYLPLYDETQSRRHEVRPGITGWAQVHGRNAVSWEERFALDVWYVDHRSFRLDLKIACMTLRAVLAGEGISADGRATMEPFGIKEPKEERTCASS